MRAQAEIKIVVHDIVGLVEAADRVEGLPAGHQAGAGHRDDLALREREPEITGLVLGGIAEGMPGDAGPRQKHAGVLHPAVGIEELGTDHAHLRPLRHLDEHVEPGRVDDLDVVIEKQEELAVARRPPRDC